ncbi:MAG TPA: AMP-binding protein [Thermoanaerobaculia bacterium]|jgi:long-chain acyl-CoA synthetase|nr:AMP-binding protein [Thermoanaerobaculia bacterium]
MMTTADSRRLDIAGSLRHKRIFITGATGFVGRVLVEKLLWSVPDVGKLLLLIRSGRDQSAEERLRSEVLGSEVMDRLRVRHGDDWNAWAASRVEFVPGDLGQDFFGLDPEWYATLCGSVDMVVASAATVTFDERLDRALELNTRGAGRTLALARDAGNVPLLHVSTCFVSGTREGVVPERVLQALPAGHEGGFDLDTTLAALSEVCRRISDRVDTIDTGPPFVAAGLEQARRYGFHDVYTLTKALGELLLVRDQGAVPITIVRPAIVESAVEQPFAGWIDAIRVADPLLVAYGRGRTREFPGAGGAVLDIVPVDHVVHAIIAAMAELERGTPPPGCSVYQIGSSRNPISLGELVDYAREGFAKMPLRDEHGEPIPVGPVRFVAPEKLLRSLHGRRDRVRALARGLSRLRSLRSTRLGPRLARLGSAERTLDHFIHLLKVYGPYVAHKARHDDAATRGLWSRLSAADWAEFPFDITALSWRSYIAEVHVPGVQRFALHAETGAPPPPRQDDAFVRLHARGEFASDRASTLFDLFATSARMDPDAVAFQIHRGGRWLRYTYGQALTGTGNIAHCLETGYGIAHGDRVVLWGSGSPEWVLTALAVYRLGAVTVPIDPQWPASEVDDAARLTEAKLICAAPRLAETLRAASCPVVKLAAPFVPGPHVGLLPGAKSASEVGDSGGLDSGDLASIIFTSGTTLAPKAVPLTHENFLANVRAVLQYVPSSRERMLSMLPIHHVFEFVMGLQVPIASLGTISYITEIKPGEILWMMNATRPTMMVVVPRLLDLLLNGARQKAAAGGPLRAFLFRFLSALSARTGGRFGRVLLGGVHEGFGGALRRLVGGGSTLQPRLAQSWRDMGFQVTEGYGLTETSPVLTANPWTAVRFGSVGKPLPGVDVEIRPTEGAEAGSGEIWVRGPSVMSGYYRNPEASAAVLQDGWFCTGDIGRLDADGYLHLSGRTKEIIVTDAGKNVYPEEVEFRYRGIPGVQELVVLSMPASGRGESVCAVVVPSPGATEPQLEQIRSAIAARSADVPSYQQITQVEFWWADLPKTATLKVKRGKLRDALLSGQPAGRPPPTPPVAKPAASAAAGPTPAELWVIATLSRLTHVRSDSVGAAHRLAELGLDSLAKVELIGELEARFDRRVDEASVASLSRVQDLFDLVRAESPGKRTGLSADNPAL